MLKKWISLWLTIAMLLTTVSIPALAQEDAQAAPGTEQTEVVTPAGDAGDTADKLETGDTADKPETGDTGSGTGDAPATGSGSGDSAEPTTDGDPEAEQDGDPLAPEAEPEPLTDEAANELIAAAAAALAALPDTITWDAFAAVEAAGAALAAVPADLQAQVEGADKLQPAIDALLAIYADALAALDPTADVWENQHQIKAFAEMKAQMDAAQYVKPTTEGDATLMGDTQASPAAATTDMAWLDAALLAYENAEATILPAHGDAELMTVYLPTDYNTLQEALGKVKDGDEVRLNRDINITEDELYVGCEGACTINTNKKTITFASTGSSGSGTFTLASGDITISGGGTLLYEDGGIHPAVKGDSLVSKVTLDSITLTVLYQENSGTAIDVGAVDEAIIKNCTITADMGVETTYSNVTITDTVIHATEYECIYAFTQDADNDYHTTLERVTLITDGENAVTLEQWDTAVLNMTISDSTITSTQEQAELFKITADDQNCVNLTLSSVITSHKLASGTYATGENQQVFETLAGGTVIMPTLANALAETDVSLCENYTQDDALVIPAGRELSIGTYELSASDITVNGTLAMALSNTVETAFDISDTGSLVVDGITYIAPRTSDGALGKPVFGIHKGGKMHVQRTNNQLAFAVMAGEVTIQRGFDNPDVFALGETYAIAVAEGSTLWLAGDVTIDAEITGVTYVVATDAKGKTNYMSLEAAVQNSATVKLVRDATEFFAPKGTISITKSINIDLNGHRVEFGDGMDGFDIAPAKKATVTIQNGDIITADAFAVRATGQKGALLTLNLNILSVTGVVEYGSYIKLGVNGSDIYHPMNAILGQADSVEADITLMRAILNTDEGDGRSLYAPNVKTLSITDSVIDAANVGLWLGGGTVTLNNASVNAGTDAISDADYANNNAIGGAIAAIIHAADGNPLSLTINGGTYQSDYGNALTFGYVNSVTPEQRALAVTINGGTFLADDASRYAIKKLGENTPEALVYEMVFGRDAEENAFSIAEGSYLFENTNASRKGIVTSSLSAALGMLQDGETLQMKTPYENEKEELMLRVGTTLQLSETSSSLNVKSIENHGIIRLMDGTLTAGTFKLWRVHGYENVGLEMTSITRLSEGTMAQVVPAYTLGEREYIYHAYIDIGDKRYIGGRDHDAMFTLTQDASMGMRQREGEIELLVISGTVQVNDSSYVENGVLDLGNSYLTILPGASVVVAEGVSLAAQDDHITGNLLYSDVYALTSVLDSLPDVQDINYMHYNTVNNAIARAGEITAAHKTTTAAQAALDELEKYKAVYKHAYIQTSPNLLVPDKSSYDVTVGGGTSGAVQYSIDAPADVQALLTSDYALQLSLIGETSSFETAEGYSVKTTANAQTNDAVTAELRYVRTTASEPVQQSLQNLLTFRAVPTKGDATPTAVMLDSYTHTVNLKNKSKEVKLSVTYGFSNGMRYDLDGYTATGVQIVGTGKQPLDTAYTAALQQSTVTLSPKTDTPPQKGKTYTGKLVFRLQKTGDAGTTITLESQTVSVRVTDVSPKVSVKVKSFDVLYVYAGESEGEAYYSISCLDAPTIGGANKSDVTGVSFTSEGYTFSFSEEGYDSTRMYIRSDAPFQKGTIKADATVSFTDASGFDDYTIKNVSIKVVNTSPGIKLAKKSMTINQKAGATVSVYVLQTSKKDPYAFNEIGGVQVLEGGKVSQRVKATLVKDQSGKPSWMYVTLETLEDIEKSAKLTLRFMVYNSYVYKDLPITLTPKATDVKLSASSVTMNLQSINELRQAVVPLKITPDSDKANLAAVNGVEATNGSVTVDGIQFRCNNADSLVVDAKDARLTTGSKRYAVQFDGMTKTVNLTVKVIDKYQTVKLQKSSVTVNTTLMDEGIVPVVYSGGTLPEYCVTLEHTSGIVASYQNGVLRVQFNPGASKSEIVYVNVSDAHTDPKKSRLKLTVKRNDKPIQMTVKPRTTINPLNPGDEIYLDVSYKGSVASFDMTRLDYYHHGRNLEMSDETVFKYIYRSMSTGREHEIVWQSDANAVYGEGKYTYTLRMRMHYFGVDITSKPFTITAAAPKLKITADAVTLHEAAPLSAVPITFVASDSHATITSVQLAKASDLYVVEKADGNTYTIRYKNAVPFGTKKWKTSDKLKLTVKVEGIKKPISVTLAISNVPNTAGN